MIKNETLINRQYRQVVTGVGRRVPAVYTDWKIPCVFTLRVSSLIRTGASRLDRSFLCTHKKLVSQIGSTLS